MSSSSEFGEFDPAPTLACGVIELQAVRNIVKMRKYKVLFRSFIDASIFQPHWLKNLLLWVGLEVEKWRIVCLQIC